MDCGAFYGLTPAMTLAPVTPRDTGDQKDLGWHYPAVDYVLSGATVNNCTLNIDQGTVLGMVSTYYEWGLRLNPGARLNVNGVPTNRVTFVRLEAVQNWPYPGWVFGEDITFKGVALPDGTPVTPYPEARFLFTDFTALAGDGSAFWSMWDDQTYDMVGRLGFFGCHFKNGTLYYESGGPAGRTLGITNCIFERTCVLLQDSYAGGQNEPETLTAANNLFYKCFMTLTPVSGATWTFIDNIFQEASLHDGSGVVNNHNAYIGMGTSRIPATAPDGDKIIDATPDSTIFQDGPLGRFYLNPSFTALINSGSRTPGEASLYHYTSRAADNQKEGGSQALVNIGPAYVALVNGAPADSNSGGPDGLPDFLADQNGDGAEDATEMPWNTEDTGPVVILAPAANALLNGVVHVSVGIPPVARSLLGVSLVDAATEQLIAAKPVKSSDTGYLTIDLDTRRLRNGLTSIKAEVETLPVGIGTSFAPQESLPVPFFIGNTVSFPDWNPQSSESQAIFNVKLPAAATAYQLLLFTSDYPKSYNPQPVDTLSGNTSEGRLTLNWQLGNSSATITKGVIHGVLATQPYLAGSGQQTPVLAPTSADSGQQTATLTPNTTIPPAFPEIGAWYIAYQDRFSHEYNPPTELNRVPIEYPVEDPLMPFSWRTWFRDGAIGGWPGVASWCRPPGSAAPCRYYAPPSPEDINKARSWPTRYVGSGYPVGGDWKQVLDNLADPEVRNLFISCHMSRYILGELYRDDIAAAVSHRYHFLFLDGCQSALLLDLFQFDHDEIYIGTSLDHYTSPPPGQVRRRPAGAVVFGFNFSQMVAQYDATGLVIVSTYIPAEVAQFYMDFQANWTLYGEKLGKALSDAATAAQATGVQTTGGTPWSRAMARGYTDLRHNEYNWRSSWSD
jgi:hypothetical protein